MKMNKTRLRDDVIINMLYGQFKNQALSNKERRSEERRVG